jgi:hypothetical protein
MQVATCILPISIKPHSPSVLSNIILLVICQSHKYLATPYTYSATWRVKLITYLRWHNPKSYRFLWCFDITIFNNQLYAYPVIHSPYWTSEPWRCTKVHEKLSIGHKHLLLTLAMTNLVETLLSIIVIVPPPSFTLFLGGEFGEAEGGVTKHFLHLIVSQRLIKVSFSSCN